MVSLWGRKNHCFHINHVKKLDPALIRKGSLVKHIELSYCGNEAFKVLAKNYLKLESHHLFSRISTLLQDARMTPADVTEHLMPKTVRRDAEIYLESLIKGLELVKEERLKAVEEGKVKESSSKDKETKKHKWRELGFR
ncbi:hypothetical protein SLEP1_g10246 [Rubroshorea leprosula]|uniref:AAA+ ATPase At3g28540-like C-terminal domain-containing protein n=1 Tax=Rubroshorea leprosula TaxID=152421 RepID=A0AAV5IDC5_9ROSI|nr:hypothetical protein SLEP1_g10246 [Rubroshorea leprosula]